MKKRAVIFLLLGILFCVNFVLADTLFFEGDLGYNEDFIMPDIEEEILESTEESTQEIVAGGGGGGPMLSPLEDLTCVMCFDFLKETIDKRQNIEFTEEEVTLLTTQINSELGLHMQEDQVLHVLENFEDECDSPLPLGGGLAAGRFRDLLNPLTIFISLLIFISVLILYFMFRKIKNIKKPRKKRKK